MVIQRPKGHECGGCHLIVPAGARQCVCGRSAVTHWDLADEAETQAVRHGQAMSLVLQGISAAVFVGILWLVYTHAGSL